jgi:hypothetical protein
MGKNRVPEIKADLERLDQDPRNYTLAQEIERKYGLALAALRHLLKLCGED